MTETEVGVDGDRCWRVVSGEWSGGRERKGREGQIKIGGRG